MGGQVAAFLRGPAISEAHGNTDACGAPSFLVGRGMKFPQRTKKHWRDNVALIKFLAEW